MGGGGAVGSPQHLPGAGEVQDGEQADEVRHEDRHEIHTEKLLAPATHSTSKMYENKIQKKSMNSNIIQSNVTTHRLACDDLFAIFGHHVCFIKFYVHIFHSITLILMEYFINYYFHKYDLKNLTL